MGTEIFSDHFKTQGMCNEVVGIHSRTFEHVPDDLNTQEMCNEAVRGGQWNLKHAPCWFVTQQQIKLGHDDTYYCFLNGMKTIKNERLKRFQ